MSEQGKSKRDALRQCWMDSLKEETTLSEAWFTADAHYAGVRPTIRSDKPNNGAETDSKTGRNENQ